MSFYGNVFYEFKNLFQKFKFINSGLNNNAVDLNVLNSTVNGTTATENWDTLHIESGNQWIGLQSLPESGTHKGVIIFHREPGQETYTTKTFEVTENAGTKLAPEQSFKTLSIDIDNAGHIANIGNEIYTLPSPEEIVQSGLTTYHGGGTFQTCLKAQGESEGTEDVTLAPGQTLEVLSMNVTDKGLLSGFTKRNYILPMTDTEKDYADVIERLGVAENKLNEMIEDTPKTYAAIADVGTVDDLYDENSTVSETFAALTHGIGNLESSSRNVNPEGKIVMPVADQISYVATVANKAEATALSYGLSIKYLEGQVEDLKKEIESLKAQLNPTE